MCHKYSFIWSYGFKKRFINIKVASNQNSIIEFLESKDINTTINIDEISEKNLKQKIEYIFKNNIYDRLDLNFSKTKLVEKIVKELEWMIDIYG